MEQSEQVPAPAPSFPHQVAKIEKAIAHLKSQTALGQLDFFGDTAIDEPMKLGTGASPIDAQLSGDSFRRRGIPGEGEGVKDALALVGKRLDEIFIVSGVSI